ncbi:ribonuclease H-like domain-containing protein [Tanacetum coccineum]
MLKHSIHQSTFRRGILGTASSVLSSAFTMANRDPTWNMDTSVSSHLNSHTVTSPSPTPYAFLSVSPSMWHQRLGHPGKDVLRSLMSRQFISCNKEKSSHLCHACQLGKHVRLPFASSDSIVTRSFEIVHSDI